MTSLIRQLVNSSIRQFILLASGFWLLASPSARAEVPPEPATSAEIDSQYADVLSAMKHPLATGVLVTEIGPASPAGAAGLRAGDIIVKLASDDVRTLQALREKVADLVASNIAADRDTKVVLVVRRAVKNVGAPAPATSPTAETFQLQIPREPLGIRAIEVEAGASAPLNPPISLRGTVPMAWDDLRKLQNAGGDLGQDSFLRNTEADDTWLGWQKRTAQPVADDALAGTVEVFHIAIEDNKAIIAHSENVSFRLRSGNYTDSPPFLLDTVDLTTHPGDGSTVTTTARRTGNTLRTETEIATKTRIIGPDKRDRDCPLSAIIPSALPLVAAALPQQKESVIPIHLMSIRDFIPRPGYVLATRGKQTMPGKKSDILPQAWRVDLLHCGVIIESYWLSDQRRLLRIDSFGGTPLISRRVPTEEEARATAEEKKSPKP